MLHHAAASTPRIHAVGIALPVGTQAAGLTDVLEAIAIEALRRETPRWLEEQGGQVRTVVGGPVAAATRAAIDRLQAELAWALGRELAVSVAGGHLDDERQRAELGLD